MSALGTNPPWNENINMDSDHENSNYRDNNRADPMSKVKVAKPNMYYSDRVKLNN